jgi:hypothetical protein
MLSSRLLATLRGTLLSVVLLTPFATACASDPADAAGSSDAVVETHTRSSLAGKRVLLIAFNYSQPGDANCFYANAEKLKRFYEKYGAAVEIHRVSKYPDPERVSGFTFAPEGNFRGDGNDDGNPGIYSLLQDLSNAGRTYDRIVTFGHGGADGMAFDGYGVGTERGAGQQLQIGWNWPNDRNAPKGVHASEWADSKRASSVLLQENLAALQKLGTLLRTLLTPSGFLYLGQCDPGQKSNIDSKVFSYVQIMACVTGNQVYGTESKSACWDIYDRVATLEGGKSSDGVGRSTPSLSEADPTNLPKRIIACQEERVAR